MILRCPCGGTVRFNGLFDGNRRSQTCPRRFRPRQTNSRDRMAHTSARGRGSEGLVKRFREQDRCGQPIRSLAVPQRPFHRPGNTKIRSGAASVGPRTTRGQGRGLCHSWWPAPRSTGHSCSSSSPCHVRRTPCRSAASPPPSRRLDSTPMSGRRDCQCCNGMLDST